MKNLKQVSLAVVAALSISAVSVAGGISGVLDGMFANVTAPSVVSSQFRGAITGGGVYLRVPNSNIQLMSLDPPRLAIGCSGVDAYLGSFSYITADKLSAFLRSIAQSGGPLIFKMAMKAMFPNLADELAYFEGIARAMNNANRNSCQLAQGILDGAKNSKDLEGALTGMVASTTGMVNGWMDDFNKALESGQTNPSKDFKKVSDAKVDYKIGNVTWNVLLARSTGGYVYGITDDTTMARQVIMSLVGTTINKEGATDAAPVIFVSAPAGNLTIKQLFNPTTYANGKTGVPILSCGTDTLNCQSPTPSTFETAGVRGYVLNQLYGDYTKAPEIQAGSILDNMINCNTDTCGLTTSQLKFLNSISKVPVIGLLLKAQGSPGVIAMIAPKLADALTDQISLLYGRSLIETTIGAFTGTEAPLPTDFSKTVGMMREDVAEAERSAKNSIETILTTAAFIDAALRANASAMRYRPH
jgi:conjugative transfer pilus assembly protein TraH